MRSVRRVGIRTSFTALAAALAISAPACSAEKEGDVSPPRGSPRTEPSPGSVPDRLADGSSLPELPSAVTSAFDRPVIGSERVAPDHPLVDACLARERQHASPDPFEGILAGAYLSSFGGGVQFETTASISGEDPDRAMTTCDAVWRSGEPRAGASALHPWSDDDALRAAGGALSYSEGVAFLSVPVPESAAWLVHDRESHLVAYPVAEALPIRVSMPVERTTDTLTVSVVYLDEDGDRLGTEEVTGVVAG